jgi:hypothetical protein
MSDSTDTQGNSSEEAASEACHRNDVSSRGHANSNHSNWRRKLLLTALGAVVGGAIRAILDWALGEIHP